MYASCLQKLVNAAITRPVGITMYCRKAVVSFTMVAVEETATIFTPKNCVSNDVNIVHEHPSLSRQVQFIHLSQVHNLTQLQVVCICYLNNIKLFVYQSEYFYKHAGVLQ